MYRPITDDIKWLSVNGFVEQNMDGDNSEVLISFIDITKQRLAENEMKKLNEELEWRVMKRTNELNIANKEMESFVYSISHDLRAPLRSITGFSEIISRRYKDNLNEEGREYLGYILEASKNMANLIEDLLKFSRLGKNRIKKDSINLNEIIKIVLQNLDKDINENKAKVFFSEELPVVNGEKTLLSQILTNLIHNAIIYHKTGMMPEIDLMVEVSEQNYIIKVKDNGQGIPKEHHEKIFDIFQRLHSQDEYPGTGIGLSIVKKAVNILGGSISLESEVGIGSTFIITLPNE